jgi:hypothetical protein
MFVRAYLRASTDEQDANRARGQLNAFAAERNLTIAAWYVENESGTKLARPELFRLLQDSRPGDVLLIEQVDRLSRLTASDWERLKADLAATCWLLWHARITTTGGGGRCRDKPRPRLRDSTKAVRRILSALPALRSCSRPDSLTPTYRTLRAVHGAPWRRLPAAFRVSALSRQVRLHEPGSVQGLLALMTAQVCAREGPPVHAGGPSRCTA